MGKNPIVLVILAWVLVTFCQEKVTYAGVIVWMGLSAEIGIDPEDLKSI